jgi:hypothetical protein
VQARALVAAILMTMVFAAPVRAEEPVPSPEASATTAEPPAPAPATAPPFVLDDFGPRIAAVQQRLVWLGYSIPASEVADQRLGPKTKEAVRAFQTKFWLPPDGIVTKRTLTKLIDVAGKPGALPEWCTSIDLALCIDTTAKVLRFVRKGEVELTLDARFGTGDEATSLGVFRVVSKNRDHTSSKYGTWMPFAMFFYGNEAIHYSSYFAKDGYSGSSHGCINLRDFNKTQWLFNRTPVGTRVVVYES